MSERSDSSDSVELARAPSLLVAAGGTGGHLYPAIAVARCFVERNPGARVTFVGTERGLESRIVPRAGFALELTRSYPLRGGGLGGKLKGTLGLVSGTWDSLRLLRRLRPSVVMGVGAYVSGPLVFTASVIDYPTLILEPNASPGLANRMLAPFIDEAAIAWEATRAAFGAKAVLTGNPVRRDIAETLPYRPQDGPTRVLVFGGSQGSRAINDAVVSGLEALASGGSPVRLIHQTGPAELERVRDAYRRSAFEQYEVLPYIEDMAQAYRDSDIVVCRAGATTCAELAAAGRASILIPLTAAGGHQDQNAAMMAERGAARRLPEDDLSGARLAEWILELAQDAGSRTTMAECARSLAKPDAAARVAERLELLAKDGVRSR